MFESGPSEIIEEWLEEFEFASRRSLETRFRYCLSRPTNLSSTTPPIVPSRQWRITGVGARTTFQAGWAMAAPRSRSMNGDVAIQCKVHPAIICGYAYFFMLLSVSCSLITISTSDYRGVLIAAMAFMLLADSLFLIAIKKGGPILLWICLLGMSSSIFVVTDFVQRAPSVFAR